MEKVACRVAGANFRLFSRDCGISFFVDRQKGGVNGWSVDFSWAGSPIPKKCNRH
jgi:hypothetical protein